MRLSAMFQKKLYVRRIVRNSRDHVLDVVVATGEFAGGRGRKPVVPRGRRGGGMMRGYMGCRRIVASVLRVLI